MNKTELVDVVANAANLPRVSAMKALDAVLDAVTTALRKDDQVVLLGFGTFSVKARPAREGRNPRTGEKIAIKASKLASFKPGKALKDALVDEK